MFVMQFILQPVQVLMIVPRPCAAPQGEHHMYVAFVGKQNRGGLCTYAMPAM